MTPPHKGRAALTETEEMAHDTATPTEVESAENHALTVAEWMRQRWDVDPDEYGSTTDLRYALNRAVWGGQ